MKFSDYLKGVVEEYAPHVRDAALSVAAKKLHAADAAIRNPETLGKVLSDVLDGLAESWRCCPHGVAAGEPCAKCPKELDP